MYGGKQLRGPAAGTYAVQRRPRAKLFGRSIRTEAIKGAGILALLLSVVGALIAALLMVGEVWNQGEQKVRPGSYARTVNRGGGPAGPRGIVAVLIRGSWGPIATPTAIDSEGMIDVNFGTGGTTDAIRQALRRAQRALVVRQGTGGVKGTVTLAGPGPTDRLRIDAAHPGTRGNNFRITKRVSLTDGARNEILVFEGATLLETHSYLPGADDAGAAAAAVNAGSAYVDAVVLAAGALDPVNLAALATGADPAVDGAAQTAALNALTTENFDVVAIDANDTTSHATVAAQLNTWRNAGKRVMAVVGEPTSVAFNTRKTNAAAFNREALVYTLNGFKEGATVNEGWLAAARAASEIAGSGLTESVTHRVLEQATDLQGALSGPEIDQSIQSGALVFTKNARGQVQIEYGINTLVTLGANQDAGWKKIKRVRIRDGLINDIGIATDDLVGKVNNDPSGRAQLRMQMQTVVDRYISQGALLAGAVTEDPNNRPSGDSAFFNIEADDVDSAEKIYETFGFRFSPPAAA